MDSADIADFCTMRREQLASAVERDATRAQTHLDSQRIADKQSRVRMYDEVLKMVLG